MKNLGVFPLVIAGIIMCVFAWLGVELFSKVIFKTYVPEGYNSGYGWGAFPGAVFGVGIVAFALYRLSRRR